MTTLEEINPAFGVRITTGDLVLRLPREADLPALIDLVLDGVHDPAYMPFAAEWTDAPRAHLPGNTARWYWESLTRMRPDDWRLPLGVWYRGDFAGIQDVFPKNYPTLRILPTGSWLGRRFQGRGIGTAMRRAVATLGFDHLDARLLISEAYVDNAASLGVSRNLGYQPDGTHWSVRRGEPAEQQRLVLTPGAFRRGRDKVEVDGLASFRRHIGLTAGLT